MIPFKPHRGGRRAAIAPLTAILLIPLMGLAAFAVDLGWIVLITIPGALLPACMVAIFGKRQRRRTLEELAR